MGLYDPTSQGRVLKGGRTFYEGTLLFDLPPGSRIAPGYSLASVYQIDYVNQTLQIFGVAYSGQYTLKYRKLESSDIQYDDNNNTIYDKLNESSFLDGNIKSVKGANSTQSDPYADSTLSEGPIYIEFDFPNQRALEVGNNELVRDIYRSIVGSGSGGSFTNDEVQPLISPQFVVTSEGGAALLVNRDVNLYGVKGAKIIFVRIKGEFRPLWVGAR